MGLAYSELGKNTPNYHNKEEFHGNPTSIARVTYPIYTPEPCWGLEPKSHLGLLDYY